MFVARKPDGKIYGLWTMRQHEGQEELSDDHPEVVEFQAWVSSMSKMPSTKGE